MWVSHNANKAFELLPPIITASAETRWMSNPTIRMNLPPSVLFTGASGQHDSDGPALRIEALERSFMQAPVTGCNDAATLRGGAAVPGCDDAACALDDRDQGHD